MRRQEFHKFVKAHNILLKQPHPASWAGYIKYKRWLAGLEWFNSGRKHWAQFRISYLKKQEEKVPLTCFYCNRTNLSIYSQDHATLATIDHIIPLAKGGGKYDEKNLLVACGRCNNKKRDMSFDTYTTGLHRLKQLSLKLIKRNRDLSTNNSVRFTTMLYYWKNFLIRWKVWTSQVSLTK